MKRLPVLALLGALLFSSSARAEKVATNYLTVGGILGISSAAGGGLDGGVGLEATLVHFWGHDRPLSGNAGLVGQLSAVGKHTHAMLGVQGGGPFAGLEIGAALDSGDAVRAQTLSLHLGPYFSTGFLGISFRFDVPVAALEAGKPAYPFTFGGALLLKFAIGLNGELLDINL